MKHLLILLTLLIVACQNKPKESISSPSYKSFHKAILPQDSLINGVSYLSVYSEIYSNDEYRTHSLISTISIRNTSSNDTLYISKGDYYNTGGQLLKSHITTPIYLAPLESAQIIIPESDKTGGLGANFLFHWHINPKNPEPIFEAVMISTYGQQGLSFVTQGKRIQ